MIVDLKGRAVPVTGVRSVRFRPDGAVLATVDADGLVALWDAETGWRSSETAYLDQVADVAFLPDGEFTAIAVHPDGTLLVTASTDGRVRLWEVVGGALVAAMHALPEGGWAVRLPSGAYQLVGDARGSFRWTCRCVSTSVNSTATCPPSGGCHRRPRCPGGPLIAA